jgi:pimeloyl-ACP methyl ester carboxylesterase
MIILGSGSPIVLIPGIQGRYEWMLPAIRALARRHQVISFSLADAGAEFERWIDQIDGALERAGVRRATIVGVSFGGVIAARYASLRPDRVSRLILVSAPSPRWQPDARTSRYLKRPLWSVPAFALGAIGRLLPEVIASQPSWTRRTTFLVQHLARVLRFPASPKQMAERVRCWKSVDIAADCARITAPTLLMTGEEELDRVVARKSSLEYLTLIPCATHVTLARTGHIGLVTTPDVFAEIVDGFADAPPHASGPRNAVPDAVYS